MGSPEPNLHENGSLRVSKRAPAKEKDTLRRICFFYVFNEFLCFEGPGTVPKLILGSYFPDVCVIKTSKFL